MSAEFRCKAILFDLDGTLIDSRASVSRAWVRWCLMNGLEPGQIVPKIQGRRSIDSIRLFAPHLNAEEQDRVMRQLETSDTRGVSPLRGALEFLRSLPAGCWSVVTSGTSDVAQARMRAGGIQVPDRAVYGEDVRNGKPNPEAFLTGAAKLEVSPEDCLVFEDTLAGVRAAKAAGMTAICLREEGQNEADACIRDFLGVKCDITAKELIVRLIPQDRQKW